MKQKELMYFTMWHARCEILRHSRPESCILSTKILCDLLNHLGIKAMPVAVDVIGFNRVALEKQKRGESFDVDDPNEDAFGMRCKVDPVNEDPSGSSWPGHLALLGGGYLLDPSADQFTRPAHNFFVKPSMMAFRSGTAIEEWLLGGERFGFEPDEGGIISYQAHPGVLGYRISSDWEDSVPGDGLYDSVMNKTLGLIGLYENEETLPELPELPEPAKTTAEIISDTVRSIDELGYTIKDLVERENAELSRIEIRKRNLEKLKESDSYTFDPTKMDIKPGF